LEDDLVRSKKFLYYINFLLNKYEKELPGGFLSDIRALFNLKFGDGKRIIKIIKISPERILEPPGTMGFAQKKALQRLILEGERDAEKWLNNRQDYHFL